MQCTRNRYSKADNIKSILILLADIHTYIYMLAFKQILRLGLDLKLLTSNYLQHLELFTPLLKTDSK